MPLYLLDPYENGPETCGSPSIDLKQFKTQALEAIKDGISLRIHTIGDRAVREMLDIFEEGTKLYGKRDIRHVQEHHDGRKDRLSGGMKIEKKDSEWYTLSISQSIPFVLLESKKRGKDLCHTKKVKEVLDMEQYEKAMEKVYKTTANEQTLDEAMMAYK